MLRNDTEKWVEVGIDPDGETCLIAIYDFDPRPGDNGASYDPDIEGYTNIEVLAPSTYHRLPVSITVLPEGGE